MTRKDPNRQKSIYLMFVQVICAGLDAAKQKEATSIAIPLVGAGKQRQNPVEMSHAIVKSCSEFALTQVEIKYENLLDFEFNYGTSNQGIILSIFFTYCTGTYLNAKSRSLDRSTKSKWWPTMRKLMPRFSWS